MINWGEIYKSTWWGYFSATGFGSIYYDIANSEQVNYTERIIEDGGTVESEDCLVDLDVIPQLTIAMIPIAYKVNKLYSVIPINGDSDLIPTRSTLATRINSDGLVENVAAGVPRLDYTDGDCPSYLLERYSTNFVPYSEDFSSWNYTGSPTITSNYGVSPDGNNNSTRVQGAVAIYVDPVASTNFSRSIYIKSTSGNGTIQALSHNRNSNNIFNIDENWQRIDVNSLTNNTGNNVFYAIDLRGSSTDIFDVEIWGAQAEREVSEPSSYIPTSGTIATRVEDAVSKTGLSTYINGVEGTFYFEGKANSTANITLYTSVNQRLWIEFNETDTRAYLNNGSGIVNLNINSETVDFDSYRKVAFSYKENEFKLYVNGVGNTITPTQTTFGVNDLDGINLGVGNKFYGNVKDLRVFDEALTDTELITLTT